jgi:hypothetical protein
MVTQWTPMRWPNAWKDAFLFSLLKGTSIDCLIFDTKTQSQLRGRADQDGFHTADLASLPHDITVAKGEWPGVKMARRGSGDISAGPTGVPWVDNNGWKVRLESALHPGTSVWIDAPPPDKSRIAGGSYLTAVADSAVQGGRWIINLDADLAEGVATQRAPALATWKTITQAADFFATHKDWATQEPVALVGVVSDFAGKNEFFGQELLNLLGRAGAQCRPLIKSGALKLVPPDEPTSMRAVIYADSDAPSAALRKQILTFVEAGGLLVASPQWGQGARGSGENPRYSIRTLGKGRVAQSMADPDDPYLWANDAVIMVSHRYDLVRFWNGGATASHYAISPDRKQAVVHLLFYSNRGPDSASVRVAGRYRSVRASTIDQQKLANVELQMQKDAVEIHLPQVSQYVALELEA